MAKYPIKMLKDEEGNAFVPLTSSEALKTPDGKTLDEKLQNKLETTNIKAGTDINITVDGNNVTINNASKGVLIDNLTTETPGVGSLDAHQGKVLKEMIPEVVNNVTSTDSDKALSAYQGYLLSGKVVPTGGKEGQVLKKSSDTNWSLEWGDAADPNAIVGDGSIKKIVELTYEEYQALETIDPDTEYHIIDAQSAIDNLQTTLDSLQEQINNTRTNLNNLGNYTFREDYVVNKTGTMPTSSSYSNIDSYTNTKSYKRVGLFMVYLVYASNATGTRGLNLRSGVSQMIASQCTGCPGGNTTRLNYTYPLLLEPNETIYIQSFQDSGTELGYTYSIKILWLDNNQ